MKNTIQRSFEIKDYRIPKTDFGDFWMTFETKEKLKTKITYVPENGKKFSASDVKSVIEEIISKSKYFKENLPENIKVEVLFKNLSEDCYNPTENTIPNFEFKEMDEISVLFYFIVDYYL
ncbi:hypothetical protein [Methanococcus maripaludis]|uniref:Uncharacterized protein n=1 Tax=Methanococcus maripaludis TaxID=39152 RepID=A0A8T4CKZ5_METMI|nr:hypothetical protein [Methanococcus maripaludis]MBM7409064.1 hypothetical protein [Methanococcus maripaludis]MBP2218750.1 hypothetical protein [Methanococcus maripaludis]